MLVYLLVVIILYKEYSIYDNYVNEPNITVKITSWAGLANRIRVVLSYLYKARKENKKLIIVWTPDGACPD